MTESKPILKKRRVSTESKPLLKKRRVSTQETEKTNIGVLVSKQLYTDFRKHCLDIGESPGNLLGRLIEDYLKKERRKNEKARIDASPTMERSAPTEKK